MLILHTYVSGRRGGTFQDVPGRLVDLPRPWKPWITRFRITSYPPFPPPLGRLGFVHRPVHKLHKPGDEFIKFSLKPLPGLFRAARESGRARLPLAGEQQDRAASVGYRACFSVLPRPIRSTDRPGLSLPTRVYSLTRQNIAPHRRQGSYSTVTSACLAASQDGSRPFGLSSGMGSDTL